MSFYSAMPEKWDGLVNVLNTKQEWHVFAVNLPSSSHHPDYSSMEAEVIKWLKDHAGEQLHPCYHPIHRNITEINDGKWCWVDNRGGSWLIIFDTDLSIQFKLTFGWESVHPLLPMIFAKF